jgi:hypothetical protein
LCPPCSSSWTPPTAIVSSILVNTHRSRERSLPPTRPDGRTRTEVAFRDADVRVIDVAIDDVGDDGVGMFSCADAIGQTASGVWSRDSERLVGITRSPRTCWRC